MKQQIYAIATILFFCLPAQAEDALQAADFDENGDGHLDRFEHARFAAAVFKPTIQEVDGGNKDSLIDREELIAWAERYSLDTDFASGADSITIVNAMDAMPPPDAKQWGVGKLRLRKDHASIIARSLSKADPATATFFRNNSTHQDTWSVEAAIGYMEEFGRIEGKSFGTYTFDPLQYAVSGGINRIDGIGAGNLTEADVLTLRTGLVTGLLGGSTSFWEYQLFSVAYRGTSDTDFDSYVHGLEMSWEPMRNKMDEIGINGPYRKALGGILDYRSIFVPKLEFGDTPKGVPGAGDEYLKIGPTVGISIFPKGVNRLEIFGNYSYRWELLGGAPEDFDYWELGARYQLDEAGQAFFEAKYRLGTLPDKFSHIDVTQFGLGIKF